MAKLKTLQPRVSRLQSRLPTVQADSWRTNKQTSGQRGYDYRWQKARKAYLAKHPLCVLCMAAGRTTASDTVDHRIPHRGDVTLFWDETNWQALCAPCHSSTKQREEGQEGRGRVNL